MSSPTVTLAAFDFDGTLTDRDSVVPFSRSVTTRSAFARAASLTPQVAAAVARRDRDRIRELATRAVFTGLGYDLVERAGETYATTHLVHRLRPDTVATLREHQGAGALTVIVSASYGVYLRPLADHLGVDGIVATELEVSDGVCTGRLLHGNCRGPAKVTALEAWLTERGLQRDDVDLWAYGDSAGDRELLEYADHPNWVKRAR